MLLNYRLRNIYSDEAIDFHSQKIPKLGSNYVCLIVIVIDYVLQKDGSFYLQMFLKKKQKHWKRTQSGNAYYWWIKKFIW